MNSLPERPLHEWAAEQLAVARTAVYLIYGDSDRLLYIGMGVNPTVRLSSHTHKRWWREAVRVDIRWFDTRPEAEEAERVLIATLHPVHNGTFAVRLPPVVAAPVVVHDDEQAEMTMTRMSRRVGIPECAIKRAIEMGFLIPRHRTSPGAARGRFLFSERAIDEFERRWRVGEFDAVAPPSAGGSSPKAQPATPTEEP